MKHQTEAQRRSRERFNIQHASRDLHKRKENKAAHVTRATIANITPEGLALKLNESGKQSQIPATIHASIGVSKWGTELGATIETTARWDVFGIFICDVLTDLNEKAAYITEDGEKAFLLWRDGKLEVIKQDE